ncbi:ABC transporter ATP-binding protein [Halospeciosus flavus]|uniref:Molybdate/tungstate import ATP-binding protein WtpC n=1 Tax=Halospeciosus flavus TaxID=3032283 RepID=A0ABD5Z830_9EURY|nr:ABC transporter ATP-binding protein [Halospeciosus flavus]
MMLSAAVRKQFTAEGAEPFDVDAGIEVADGETLVILGPSGSGKTLLLESIAGFHDHEGHVQLGDRDITDAPPEEREFGFVFQDYGLFPHMTVRENVAFGERYYDDTRDPDELLESLGVAHLTERSPPTLSGGESQRVALARSLAVRPDALLLDEPLSALDVPTRQSLRDDLADALAGVTSVYVTHNRTTARALADRIAVMRDGEVVQTGDPETIFGSPATPYVARFVGANVLPAERFDRGADVARVAIRPEHVVLDPTDPDGRATVERATREDAAFRVVLDWDGEHVETFADDPPAVGASVGVGFPAESLADLRRE